MQKILAGLSVVALGSFIATPASPQDNSHCQQQAVHYCATNNGWQTLGYANYNDCYAEQYHLCMTGGGPDGCGDPWVSDPCPHEN